MILIISLKGVRNDALCYDYLFIFLKFDFLHKEEFLLPNY